jgi:hypothetical protein
LGKVEETGKENNRRVCSKKLQPPNVLPHPQSLLGKKALSITPPQLKNFSSMYGVLWLNCFVKKLSCARLKGECFPRLRCGIQGEEVVISKS